MTKPTLKPTISSAFNALGHPRKLAVAVAFAGFAMTGFSQSVAADPVKDAVDKFLAAPATNALLADPALIASIEAQNVAHAAISQADVDALDQTWRAEVGAAESSQLITKVLKNDVADRLRAFASGSQGNVLEIILMDQAGLNVAVSHTTSDYWQGDEAKHQQTFGLGAGAVFVDEIEFDNSSQQYTVQVSLTVQNRAGEAIGAVTFALDATTIH